MPIKTYLDSGSDIKEVLHLEEFKVVQTINEHATLYLTARLQEKAEIEYVRTAKSLDIIEVVTTEPAYKTIFKGVVTNIQIKQIEKAYYLIVEGLSSSYLADIGNFQPFLPGRRRNLHFYCEYGNCHALYKSWYGKSGAKNRRCY